MKLIPKYFFLNSSGDSLGPPHFKVRLFESELLNSEELTKNKSYGFFIESSKDAGKRCSKDSLVLTKEEASKQNLPGSLNATFLLNLSEYILVNEDKEFFFKWIDTV